MVPCWWYFSEESRPPVPVHVCDGRGTRIAVQPYVVHILWGPHSHGFRSHTVCRSLAPRNEHQVSSLERIELIYMVHFVVFLLLIVFPCKNCTYIKAYINICINLEKAFA